MKKILVIHTNYQIQGGEDIAVSNEVEFLKQYFEVKTIYFSNIIDNYFVQTINFLRNRNKTSEKKVEYQIKNFRPDLIIIHNTWFKGSLGIFKIIKKYDIKVALKLHNFRYNCSRFYLLKNHLKNQEICNACGIEKKPKRIFNKYFEDSYFKSLLIIWYGKKYFKILNEENKTIFVLTEFHKNYLNNVLGIKNKIVNFPNYLNVDQNSKNTTKEKYIVYAGRISKEKGVEDLIIQFLKIKNKEFSLKLIGIGPIFEELKNKFQSHKVNFLGQMSNEETIKILLNSKAVVTATKLLEGQPTLLCEASLLGVPSIFPENGGISEFFPKNYKLSFKKDNYEDLLVKLNLLSNEKLLIKVGNENKNFIEKYLQDSKLKTIIDDF